MNYMITDNYGCSPANYKENKDMRKIPSNYINLYRGLHKFMKANNYTALNEDVGLECVRNRTGTTMEGFYGRGDQKTNVYMKPVQNLLVYMKTGSLSYYMRPKLSDFQCPEGFEEDYRILIRTLW